MRVFEFHFNPQVKKDKIFDTFYYEPENVYEKRLGYLFLAGELSNALPSQERFLKNLARTIKTQFYSFKNNLPAAALKNTLKQTNEFLQKVAKEGDVRWISHLNFAILNLCFKKKQSKKRPIKYRLNFTKTGDIGIFLCRSGKILDIGQNLKQEEIEPYPLKIFFNIAFGNLEQKDRILIMSQEMAEIFVNQGIAEKIASLPFLEEKPLNEILNEVQKDITGICLLIGLEKEPAFAKVTAGKQRKLVFRPKILSHLPKIQIPSFFGKKDMRYPVDIAYLKRIFKRKNANLIFIFVVLLGLAAGWAKIEENRQKAQILAKLEIAQEKINEAKSLLISNEDQKANELFLQALQEIEPFFTTTVLEQEISQMKNTIEAELFGLNKMVMIEEPELVYQFTFHHDNGEGFLPEKMIFFQSKLYFFSPYFGNVYELENKKVRLISTEQRFQQAVAIESAVLFFQKPNLIFPLLIDQKIGEPISLSGSLEGTELENISSFRSNLYFLDKKGEQIIKFSYLGDLQWGDSQRWSAPHQNIGGGSAVVDGGVWVLKGENSIDRYYAGQLQKTLEIKIFPFCQQPSKIWSSSALPYLYILEPNQKRIIVLDKQSQIVKQFQSEKFDNLKDFAVSENGKAIYLLNGSSVYLISL